MDLRVEDAKKRAIELLDKDDDYISLVRISDPAFTICAKETAFAVVDEVEFADKCSIDYIAAAIVDQVIYTLFIYCLVWKFFDKFNGESFSGYILYGRHICTWSTHDTVNLAFTDKGLVYEVEFDFLQPNSKDEWSSIKCPIGSYACMVSLRDENNHLLAHDIINISEIGPKVVTRLLDKIK